MSKCGRLWFGGGPGRTYYVLIPGMPAPRVCACFAGKLAAAGVQIPTVEVEYDGVTMEANALVGDAGIPTLANTARGWIRVRPPSI